jgi:hypothetical protein
MVSLVYSFLWDSSGFTVRFDAAVAISQDPCNSVYHLLFVKYRCTTGLSVSSTGWTFSYDTY